MTDSLAEQIGHLLIVGGGSMGQAICSGVLNIDGVTPASITVANPGQEKRTAIEERFGVTTCSNACEGLPADTVILAVKPNKVDEVAAQVAPSGLGSATLISVAAGVPTARLSTLFGEDVPVARVMPNTPLLYGEGMSAVSIGADTPSGTADFVVALFQSMGRAVVVEERIQDVVTAISGSGPAYFELLAKLMSETACDLGMDADLARTLTIQTMRGTAELLERSEQSFDEAITAVSSPGGTTVAALDAMRADGLEEAVDDGVRAAARRSEELSS
ncbi:MAG: pyrroline-5-carboxylate reductase [Coriobacteriaceae bacterium]|nr:pyrroline-5-carboxylate reductase [Coriobacteriaceae bacterium]